MKIYFIRHTAVDVPAGVCYGQTDVPLKNSFEEEAGIVKEQLKNMSPDAVFSSPLSRCTGLADFCGFSNPQLDNRLKELNFGDWEGVKWDETNIDLWSADWINTPPPNGESFVQMYERIASFLEELKKETYDTVFIFAHGGVISCVRIYFKQIDFSEAFESVPKYGEIVEFEL